MTFIWLIGAALVAANLCVSIFVVRSAFYSPLQKLGQCAIVWFLPVVGCVGVGVFLYSQRDNPIFDTRAYPERSEKANIALVEPTLHEIQGGHEP
jgi:hypothetical protein